MIADLPSFIAQYGHGPGYGIYNPTHILIIAVSAIVSMIVSGMLRKRFAEYSQIPIRLTGAQVAERMLQQHGIHDVQVISVPGQLTDHYDPMSKTVNLSEEVYSSASVAAAAVAAHECGHAVQHQQAYVWLGLRSKMVPAVQFSSKLLNWLLIIAMLGVGFFHSATMLWVWVALFGVTTLFTFITLPVEFDASRRAMIWMDSSGIATHIEHERARNALFWAAMTYVAAAVGSLAQLVHFIMLANNRRN